MATALNASTDLHGQTPLRGAILMRRLDGRQPLRYYTFVPESFEPSRQLAVVVHGISRNAREHIVAFAPWAQRTGTALVAPLFDREHCRDFQQLGWTGAGWRVDLLLREIMSGVAQLTGADSARFALFGYSGGAQFAHRYALAHPGDVRCLATCAAGYYTWPTPQLPFPYGLDCRDTDGDSRLLLDEFLAIPTLTTVGDRDTARDRSLRKSPELDALQGRTRLERAKRWVEALGTAAAARNLQARHHFAAIEGVGHDFRKAIACGLAETVWPFLTAANTNPVAITSTRITANADADIPE